ncbi:4-coumarate--CoA ligase 2 [Orchesella cincta]|uniref:Luciferin 4-monooxygenase n=1 Tax=Orchesella cincta TaxID=48709 RepID=A0A1D2N029_ORCCI|nr:4-coumarate--CoA ligase 2 [Orchesella cincta]
MKVFRNLIKFKAHVRGIRNISDGSKWTKQKEGCSPGILTSTVDMPPITGVTLPEFLFQNLHKWENAPAMKCAITGRQYTHGEVYKRSRSFAAALKQAGFKRNDSICILLPNIPEYPIVALGSMQAGCVVSTVNPLYTRDEIAKQINDCGGKIVITIPQLVTQVEAARALCPTLTQKTIVVGGEPVNDCHSFFEMIKTDASGVEFLKGSDVNALEDGCLIPYSSGTTGPPKGVELTHSNLVTNLKQITTEGYRQTQFFEGGIPQERFLAILPFFHMYGFHVIMSVGLYQGACISCLPKFEPELYLKAVLEHKPTTLHLVTPLINFLASHPLVPNTALPSTKGVVIGAAPLGKELIAKFLTKFGSHIFLQEGYGMSEILVTNLIPQEQHNARPGSCGVLIPGTTMKIIDLESGKVLGPNQSGEICIQGGAVMKGYLKNEKATKSTIDDEKFLHTGDIGYYDEEMYLYIEDRLKDLIKVKGFQVAPSELEDIMRKHPDVADVAVVGVKHERFGEAPRAYIVKKNEKLSEDDINNFLKPQLSEHKQLVGGIEFIDTIPKAASGKILKRQLLALYNSTHQ